MKKLTKSLIVLAVVVVALASTSSVFAQGSGPGTTGVQTGSGYAGNGGRRGDGGSVYGDVYGLKDELLHDYFITAYSIEFNIEVKDLEIRLDQGETMAEIAISTGLTLDEFMTLMDEVRSEVLDQAVADGVITQEQAERIASRAAAMNRFADREQRADMGRGAGRRGSNQGLFGDAQGLYNGDCIND
jgi:hypothetical protein